MNVTIDGGKEKYFLMGVSSNCLYLDPNNPFKPIEFGSFYNAYSYSNQHLQGEDYYILKVV